MGQGPGGALLTATYGKRVFALALAGGFYAAAALAEWHSDVAVRRATGIVLATLVLWISEVAPLGVVALAIPVAALFAGVLTWAEALAAWGDPIIFLFLGAFLLARALDKFGAFDWIVSGRWARTSEAGGAVGLTLAVLVLSGAVSTVQNNTAVTAMLLPVVTTLASRTRFAGMVLLGLAFGSTFGGMATPVGTAPNFLGYAEMKRLDPSINFVSWLRVGIPVWVGAMAIGWGVLAVARALARPGRAGQYVTNAAPDTSRGTGAAAVVEPRPAFAPDPESFPLDESARRTGRLWALILFGVAALAWLTMGLVLALTPTGSPADRWIAAYLPESLVPLAAAWVLFIVPVDPRGRTVLDRRDFAAIDWDTLFLIAGGLCLGKLLKESGAAAALAHAVCGLQAPSAGLMLALAGATVLLSELTSNTATAALMVPLAGALAPALGCSPVQAIWLVALSASLGFALPISTPPNAIVYGTRLVRLRLMIGAGVAVDLLCAAWVVGCIRWFA